MANIPKYFYFRVHANKTSIEIEDASDADVVEVVRCKDCKHWEPTVSDRGYCKDLFGFGRWWKAEDSCSYGVHKDGEQNA